MCICIYVCVCAYIYINIYIYIERSICIHIHIYIYIYTCIGIGFLCMQLRPSSLETRGGSVGNCLGRGFEFGEVVRVCLPGAFYREPNGEQLKGTERTSKQPNPVLTLAVHR